jgi:8-oxo-dGTP diphosphatase
MARSPIYAAGGIVLRGRSPVLIAVVQRSKDEAWVLPRGKLKRDEDPVAGARREVVEETGHRVQVHEFLGAITYRAQGRPKVVQFWHMQAYERPSRDIMKDIIAVEWLPLGQAVRRLSYPLEKLFLQHAGRRVVRHKRKTTKRKKSRTTRKSKTTRRKARPLQSRRKTRAHPRDMSTHARRSETHQRKAPAASKSRSVLQRMLGRLGG